MKKYISKLHYLTQDVPGRSHIEQVAVACTAGANWIQYRCLTKNDDELLADMHSIAAICDDWGATLIVTNHYQLLDKADIQGVHIEDMNADFAAIRKYIGDDKTLGGSANTFKQLELAASGGHVDYMGCGPFSITLTKPNTYPVLGISGYQEIMKQLNENSIDIPVLAVGGISSGDVCNLLETGIHGIAVSAAVNLSANPEAAVSELRKLVF